MLRQSGILISLLLLGLTTRPAVAQSTNSVYLPLASTNAGGISDLALIYQGGTHRPPWATDQLAPYVSFRDPDTQREEWLFDGFLFIEYKDNRGREYAHGYRQKPGRQEDWLWLLERNFARDCAIDALEQCVAAAAKRLGAPSHRRQVVLTLPEPISGQQDWGTLDGRALNFNQLEDRLAACSWHIKTAIAKWKACAPAHLELAGFYWVAESSNAATELLPRVARAIHEQGLRFYWIPYWRAQGAPHWRQLGFDAVYQQPNHFFHPEVPDRRLTEACVFARAHQMGMEVEFDARAIQSPDVFRPRFHAYFDFYERENAKSQAAMAYYEGGGTLLDLFKSADPQVHRLYDRVARWVSSRQKLATNLVPGRPH